MPIYGRMADVFGRRPVLYAGIALFLAGSILCGIAWNMPSLIVFRGLQGLGAGAIAPLVQTVVGDMYSVKERARIQGYTASVWGSLLAARTAVRRGVVAEWASWRWIFYINMPDRGPRPRSLLLQRNLHESIDRGAATSSTTLGAAVLTVRPRRVHLRPPAGRHHLVVALADSEDCRPRRRGGRRSSPSASSNCRAVEPMVPPWVDLPASAPRRQHRRTSPSARRSSDSPSYVPAYAQGVRRVDPVVSGLAVAAVTLGWPIASGYAGRLYLRFGFRATAILGGRRSTSAARRSSSPSAASTPILVVAKCFGFLTGVGMGLTATPVLVALQSLVGWERRGVVTASNIFARSIGSALGIAVLGSVANSSLASWLRHPPAATFEVAVRSSVNVTSRILGGGKVALSACARPRTYGPGCCMRPTMFSSASPRPRWSPPRGRCSSVRPQAATASRRPLRLGASNAPGITEAVAR